MKAVQLSRLWALAAIGLCANGAIAQEQGRVVSSTPVIQQVAVPRQVCNNEQVSAAGSNAKSGLGALIGGIAGGAVGNAMGNGSGRAATTALGVFGGAILGNQLEAEKSEPTVQTVQRCTQQTFYENRTTAYNVVYEFNGKQYQVQMPQDPGPFVTLQVTPVPTAAPAAPATIRPISQAPLTTQPVVFENTTVYLPSPTIHRPPAVVYATPPVIYGGFHGHSGFRGHPTFGSSIGIGYFGGMR